MAYALIGGQELLVKSGIVLLQAKQLLGKSGEGLPGWANPLLKHAPNACVGGINGEGELLGGVWVH